MSSAPEGRIAILGAGPVGLEAALYARYLGYAVEVFERGQFCENLLRRGHAQLFDPIDSLHSKLGIAALQAQDPAWQARDDSRSVTAYELVEHYFLPLAKSDLLVDHLFERHTVVAVGHEGPRRDELRTAAVRAPFPFRLLVRNEHGEEFDRTADIVIDATGNSLHNWLGAGGAPAIGELAAAEAIEYDLPDVLNAQRSTYADRHTLLVGEGLSAAATAVALAQLVKESLRTTLTWATSPPETAWLLAGESDDEEDDASDVPSEEDEGVAARDVLADAYSIVVYGGPIARTANHRLPARDQLAEAANSIAEQALMAFTPRIRYLPSTVVQSIERTADGRFRVALTGRTAETVEVDRIVAAVGHRPDPSLWTELQVSTPWGNSLPAPEELILAEPNFYVIGSKSTASAAFSMSDARAQIRQLFAHLGGRAELDLYATFK